MPKCVIRLVLALWVGVSPVVPAQDQPEAPEGPRVEVAREFSDEEIAARLAGILEATDWFEATEVTVDEGVVFLEGTADSEARRAWATALAERTDGVVAAVNRMGLAAQPGVDLSPAWTEMRELRYKLVHNSPLIALALVLLVLSWVAARWTARGSRALLGRRMGSELLGTVVARILASLVFVIGIYLVLRISGLTRLAVTLLGGTGLLGLVVGFAFRDIAENFLASILLSIQRPFAGGDRIRVAGHEGFVQSVNTRSTLLMTLEGNHVQIPNATIYKQPIINFTANPNARFDFVVGIGYDDSISRAQKVAMAVLRGHPGVVDEPEPMVLAEQLGSATVNLRIYFWVDITRFGAPKVRSAIIRLVKKAYTEAGISMPDEAREVVFPAGVPVRMVDAGPAAPAPAPAEAGEDAAASSAAEGGLHSEAGEIREQARAARNPEAGRNLLE
jgi:small conductance mechanosensitive channel